MLQKVLEILNTEKSFDLVRREIAVGGRPACILFVDGMVKDEVMEKMLEYFLKLPEDIFDKAPDMRAFSRMVIPYIEVAESKKPEAACVQILSGVLALAIEGYEELALIDVRTYPVRGVEEPEKDRVMRGSRDGFVETVVFNTALIRRRIRDPKLVMEIQSAGESSHTDIVLCYMSDRADMELVKQMRRRIAELNVHALTMNQESLAEALVRGRWFNPFPKVRYTERPDAAAASVLEGKIVALVDNSPSAMILPSAIFDFFQEADDYYFPPLVGTYLRISRVLIFLATLFFTPVWLLLMQNPGWIPPWLDFIRVQEPNSVPLLMQLLILEFAVDGLRMASLNTPSTLSSAMSIVGGLVLGEFAVSSGWFVPDTILYAAFVAIANYTQPSFELGYAFKFTRIMLLVLTGIWNLWGFSAGLFIFLLAVGCTRTISGKSYLYPLFPFNGRELRQVFFRAKLNSRPHRSREEY
ncbi:MAG: spore germination protein [Oscillospiraceae bacterium]|nr:spore germination protein [Oscillospiraceae bacterium]